MASLSRAMVMGFETLDMLIPGVVWGGRNEEPTKNWQTDT